MADTHVSNKLRQKLDSKCEKLRFIEYSIELKAYRLLNESTNKILVRRDIPFNETDFGHSNECIPNFESAPVELQYIIEPNNQEFMQKEPALNTSNQPQQFQPRRSERTHQPPQLFGVDEYVSTTSSTLGLFC